MSNSIRAGIRISTTAMPSPATPARDRLPTRVLIHVDTELGAKDLLNSRMAYVAVSRGAHDAQIFTNDREKLPAALGHDVSQQSAHVPEIKPNQTIAPQQEVSQGQQQNHGIGLGMGF